MEAAEVQAEVGALVEQAHVLTIRNQADYEAAGAFVVACARQLKRIGEVFDPIVQKAHAAHKEALAQKRAVSAPVEQAKREIGGRIGAYDRKQEEERRRAEAAERERLRKIEEERRLAEAEELERVGQTEQAEAVIEEPLVVAPVPRPAPPKPKGVSVRTMWAYRITDASQIRPAYLVPDEKKIGQVVRAMGENAIALVGGIEVYKKPVVSVRTQ